MGNELRVTVVATGLGSLQVERSQNLSEEIQKKIAGDGVIDYADLDRPTVIRNATVDAKSDDALPVGKDLEYLDIPAFLRRQAD